MMHPTEAVTCNQLPIISALASAPGSWINREKKKNATPPTHPQSLESCPAEWHFHHHHHQWYNGLILRPRGEENSLRWKLDQFPPGAQHRCLWGREGGWVGRWVVGWSRGGFSMNPNHSSAHWIHCFEEGQPVVPADWFVSCESGTLQKQTYHHSIVRGSVCRTLSIDDCYIEGSLISGFWGGDKWENKREARWGEGKMRKRSTSKHFN